MTKREKAIYSKYGIQTSNNKLVTPLVIDGNAITCNPVLKNGNTKVGKGVFTFSTLPTNQEFNTEFGTVKGTCCCNCVGCYATKGFYQFKSNVNALAINTILIRNYPDWIESAINAQLEIIGNCDVRISASGDMESQNIVDLWARIATKNANCRFWTYTKYSEFENAFNNIPNANIVKSLIPDIGYNFGHCDYIIDTYNKLKAQNKNVHICKCGFDDKEHCNNCDGCRINEFVLFVEHSTSYKATEDASFNKLAMIVNNQ